MPSFLFFAADAPPSIPLVLRINLSLMSFLQFAVWGAWYVVLGNYLNALGFSRKDIGRAYATIPIGAVITPMFTGTIADKYFPAEQVMGILHVAGCLLLGWMAVARTPRLFFWVALAYSLVYTPTLALSNTVVFQSLPELLQFPEFRVMGTIGWIAAGLALRFFIRPGEQVNNRPLLFAAALSLILGVFSLRFLPQTPVMDSASGEIPFLKALAMFKDPPAAIFLISSFVISIALAFYYSFTALYLEHGLKVKPENVGPLMTIGQWVEIIFMLSLAWFVRSLGMKAVLSIGIAAWAIRYGIFASRAPLPVAIVGIALHGICFDFFLAAGMMHTQSIAPEDIKASAQSLLGVLTYGLGMWVGTEASGWLNQYFTREFVDPATGAKEIVTDWTGFWLVPCVGSAICLAVFLLIFRA